MIEALGLTMRFGHRTVVEGLSFRVERGELCAFLGRNGAGKTTTMRMLAGVLRPSGGTARVDGRDVIAERRAAAAAIGFLPEAATGFSRLTVGEFLRFCGESRGLAGSALAAAIDRATGLVHAREACGALMGELSKGWRQRAWLAQALLPDPPVLILDEPTDGLDPVERARIRALLRQVAENKAILLSTHVLEEAEEVATRVLLVERGRIVADAVPADLVDERGRLGPAFHRLAGHDPEFPLGRP
ncbi:MAG: ABC transporter ATP-binding protein [Thiotrichales bacterium]|nr:ABC transporter ATP-binding protein [Thiotrichales bacterium]